MHTLYVLEAFRIHIRYMRIGCMQSTLWPISMTMLIWNDLMTSQQDNLSRGSPRLMTSDRQILYPQVVPVCHSVQPLDVRVGGPHCLSLD